MIRNFKLIRRAPSDIRNQIKEQWLPFLEDFLPAEHYPIILNRHFRVLDYNKTKREIDRRPVDLEKPDFRIFHGLENWVHVPIVPNKEKQGKNYKYFLERYEEYPLVHRQLGAVIAALNEKNWTGVAEEVLELFCKANGQKMPKGELAIEHMLVVQPDHAFFLVRNQQEFGEFVVLDLYGQGCQDDLYATSTAYDTFGSSYSFTRHRAADWPKYVERNFLGLMREPEDLPQEIESRIRKDLNWSFGSHYSDAINPLLKFAVSKLEPFGERVAILAGQYRFNDAGNDENWMAVRLDDYSWDNGCYFSNSLDKLGDMSDDARILVGVVSQVVAAKLMAKFTETTGYVFDAMDVWGIIRQDRKWLFAFSSSNGYDGAVYEIDPSSGALIFLGLAARFDWDLPLRWITVDNWLQGLQSGEIPEYSDEAFDMRIKYKDLLPNRQ